MTTIDRIEQELDEAKQQLANAEAALAKFEKEDKELLGTLSIRLLKKEYDDEEKKNIWKRIIESLEREKNQMETGNGFVTRVLGLRVSRVGCCCVFFLYLL